MLLCVCLSLLPLLSLSLPHPRPRPPSLSLSVCLSLGKLQCLRTIAMHTNLLEKLPIENLLTLSALTSLSCQGLRLCLRMCVSLRLRLCLCLCLCLRLRLRLRLCLCLRLHLTLSPSHHQGNPKLYSPPPEIANQGRN